MKIKVLNLKKESIGDIEVSKDVFDVPFRNDLVEKYLRVYLNNQRKFSASVKDRSEVSGGGKKPWAQKGTGRARQGSIRSPLWRKGGVVHGPVPGKRWLKMNDKEKDLFYRVVLSEYLRSGNLFVLSREDVKEKLSEVKRYTKEVKELLCKDFGENLVFITSEKNKVLYLGLRNLEDAKYMVVDGINWFDIINSDVILMDDGVVNYFNKISKKE